MILLGRHFAVVIGGRRASIPALRVGHPFLAVVTGSDGVASTVPVPVSADDYSDRRQKSACAAFPSFPNFLQRICRRGLESLRLGGTHAAHPTAVVSESGGV